MRKQWENMIGRQRKSTSTTVVDSAVTNSYSGSNRSDLTNV